MAHPAASGGKWIRMDKRLSIYMRDHGACVYCLRQDNLTLDHLRPHSKGGSNEASNLVTACLRCNSARGNRSWVDFASAFEGATGRIQRQRRRVLPRENAKVALAQCGSVRKAIEANR